MYAQFFFTEEKLKTEFTHTVNSSSYQVSGRNIASAKVVPLSVRGESDSVSTDSHHVKINDVNTPSVVNTPTPK